MGKEEEWGVFWETQKDSQESAREEQRTTSLHKVLRMVWKFSNVSVCTEWMLKSFLQIDNTFDGGSTRKKNKVIAQTTWVIRAHRQDWVGTLKLQEMDMCNSNKTNLLNDSTMPNWSIKRFEGRCIAKMFSLIQVEFKPRIAVGQLGRSGSVGCSGCQSIDGIGRRKTMNETMGRQQPKMSYIVVKPNKPSCLHFLPCTCKE